jgi:predicted molibdopterin-dependent oxidoreductase YjgC
VAAPGRAPRPDFPLRLTTGRTVAHFLSGNQTRRLPGLVEQTPRPWVEVHPRSASPTATRCGW